MNAAARWRGQADSKKESKKQKAKTKKPLGAHTERLSTFRPQEVGSLPAKELHRAFQPPAYFAGVVAPEWSIFDAPVFAAAGLADVLSDL